MIPSYPCGSIGFILGCLDENRDMRSPIYKFSNDEIDRLGFKYYSTKIHSAAFALPRYAEKALNVS